MLRNYLKIALRNISRQKAFAFINISGLAIGFTCSFFILLWITDELSFDQFHKNGDRTVQVMRHMISDGKIDTYPSLGQPVAETILAEYPEVEDITYVMLSQQFVVTKDGSSFRDIGGYVSPTFFGIFSFPFIQGNPRTALQDVNSVVITSRAADRIFGEGWQSRNDVIGQTIMIDHRKEFTVSGVVANPPQNSSLQFDVLLAANDFTDRFGVATNWYYMIFSVYARLHEGSSLEQLNAKLLDHFNRHDQGKDTELFLQPFEEVHLHSTYRGGVLVGGRIDYLRIFGVVAGFLLLIACINFMNLATARSGRRAREIGVRKVVGAQRRALISQFMIESISMSTFAFVIALASFFLLLPYFNQLAGKTLSVNDLNEWFIFGLFGVSLAVGIISGSYPALYLSSFNPVAALRASLKQRASNSFLRKGLVIFQFAISVLMIVATVGVFLQLRHLRTIDLGLQREGLVFLPREGALREKSEFVVEELLRSPGIAAVTASGQNPLKVGNNTIGVKWDGKAPDSRPVFFVLLVDFDFIKTMGMELAEGRDFTREFNNVDTYIINEEAATLMGGNMVGKRIKLYGKEGEVVGVVKNFSMNSLYAPVAPVVIRFHPQSTSRLFVRPKAGETTEALASLKAICTKLNPGYPFEYTFLDHVFEETYRSEAIMGQLANIFAVIAVFISCLGLFGLTAFTVEQRTKEVGIRKVLGGSVLRIAALLSVEFVVLVMLGVLIALPVAGYVMSTWLQDFSSRIAMPWWLFASAAGAALLLAVVTISFQSIRAATANPVDTLRSE